jgi:hypothetical protein
MNVVRSLPRTAACLVLDAHAPLPPGPWEELGRGDVTVVLAPGARLPPGGAALAEVERAVRRGATDLVVCVERTGRVPAWAVDLVPAAADHARTQIERALGSRVVAAAVREGLRVHAWIHDRATDEVVVLDTTVLVATRVAAAAG